MDLSSYFLQDIIKIRNHGKESLSAYFVVVETFCFFSFVSRMFVIVCVAFFSLLAALNSCQICLVSVSSDY